MPDDLFDPSTDEPHTPLLSLLVSDFGGTTTDPMPMDVTPVVDPLEITPDLDV
jgi:hypothetical protein